MLYENEIVYRPPLEAESVLLEVAVGCSYGKCTFCQSSARGSRPFHAIPLETVAENARTLGSTPSEAGRESCFLLGDNVLAFPTDHLKAVFGYVNQWLPDVKRFAMYARAHDVIAKGWEGLLELKEKGLENIYMGVESGSDRILEDCRKGETTADLRRACELLDSVEISCHLSSILGLGGQALWKEHAVATAQFFNSVRPASVRVLTYTPEAGTVLAEQVEQGRFHMLTPAQALLEEYVLLYALEPQNQYLFVGTHITNNVALAGFLPDHKGELLAKLKEALNSPDLDKLEAAHPDYL